MTKKGKQKTKHQEESKAYQVSTVCFCPFCEKEHTRDMYWTGRGMPKKYCKECIKRMAKTDRSFLLTERPQNRSQKKEGGS